MPETEDIYCQDGIRYADDEWFAPPHTGDWGNRQRMISLLQDMWHYPEAESVCVAEPEPTLAERFHREADKWDSETAFVSSTPKKVLHESYQKIMAMGPDVVPLLLRDLQTNRRSWFWALRHLTQANPVPVEYQGNLDKMIASWVAWGKREGKI